jgi:transcription factor C subunit 7
VERDTGIYHSNIPSPTGIPSDPALAGYGAQQARELAEHLVTLSPPIERFYSSPFYRCIQTLYPAVEKLAALRAGGSDGDVPTNASAPRPQPELKIYAENGLGEWYGTARFDHPSPAKPEVLTALFDRFEMAYRPAIVPSTKGETIEELHDRTAYALQRVIERCDAEGVRSVVVCTHAATLYAVGRALTGRMPADVTEEDFRPFTCGLSKFVRRAGAAEGMQPPVELWKGVGSPIPETHWRGGRGVGGGWDCEINGDCSFLSGGEERGW